jgi:GTP-binding protein HflX
MIEHEASAVGQTAILVHVSFPGTDTEAETAEFVELARSAGAQVRQCVGGRRQKPDPRHFVGRGKAEELAELVAAEAAELVVFNHDLSPSQERNLERLLCCRVLDRAGLILDIFAARARTHEGKLQVELAQLQHLATRLVRGWSHLERQKGGIGLRGPGESQLETDRRLIRDRMRMLEKRLDTVRGRRARSRASRQRNETPTVSLVGYTNAGKSTLFNRLTTGDTFASRQLFATLDPTLRRFTLDPGNHVVLADTVGFIRDLPPDLVAAFRATLEETREAELLLHVVDWSDPEREQRIEQVEAVLRDIGAAEVPRIMVCNKIDQLAKADRAVDTAGEGRRVAVSAVSGEGLDRLREAVRAFFHGRIEDIEIRLPPQEARLRARLYDARAVRSETADTDGTMRLQLRMPRNQLQRMCATAGIPWEIATADPAQQADC